MLMERRSTLSEVHNAKIETKNEVIEYSRKDMPFIIDCGGGFLLRDLTYNPKDQT
jgi:hypothetical protein